MREYVRGGVLGELAAELDADERAARAAQRTGARRERERAAPLEAQTATLCAGADDLAREALLLAGYRQHHRGAWRRPRG